FSVAIAIFEMLTRGVLTMDMIQGIFSGNITIYIIFVVAIIFFRKYLKGSGDNNLEKTILALSNELQRMRTEAEWRNETASQAGSNRFSSTSHVSMGYYSEYTDEYETYWVEFTALFNNRRKKEGRSPTQLYNILSIEIGLSASTLANFYRHQKSPRKTSIDKIIEWVEKEGNKK
ncbi:36725_t:CDS:2, partial [Racocetra persica]